MTSARALLVVLVLAWGVAGWQIAAQQGQVFDSAEQADAALRAALFAQNQARQRGDRLEAEAQKATAAADRTAREGAAVAARIQEAEAQIAVESARIALVERQQHALRSRIAEKQEPVVRLTAAVQLMARRPLAFALLRPGTLDETVHMRAVLETIVPEVTRRTAGLRKEVMRARGLQAQAVRARESLSASQTALAERSRQLAQIEARQRLESRAALGVANREADRVLSLAEEARDLRGLMSQLEQDAALRTRLAALPGPVLRPARPGESAGVQGNGSVPEALESQAASGTRGLDYILPVAGRLVTGFGEKQPGGPASGTAFALRGGALVVSPAGGRVAFAGPYRGYGRIVIIEHPGGWSTLITGLGRADVIVGQQVVQGASLGQAPQGQPVVTVELRKDGAPVNVMSVTRN